ncbi:MAG TPA: DUF1800 domain-containing protein [Verrucomicrobiales bacterium]|jgi:uncharacterized protein (DUF1800 family)|nr:DUF1800 domain-containing protein [Verrucomicrobiales bacterium]
MLPPADPSLWTREAAAHLLNRAGFGGTPAEIEKLHALGREKAVDSLIDGAEDPSRFPLPEWTKPEARMELAREMADVRRSAAGAKNEPDAAQKRRQMVQMAQRRQAEQALELIGWWFNRMSATSWPLREKMTLFWHGHFATSLQKVRQTVLMQQQNELFRSHALGSFRDLTKAIVQDPAMMIYLDTNNSNKAHPNENFARELMELFTLGEGRYSEEDIKESARAFTGYRFRPLFENASRFAPFQHDNGEKTFFGQKGRFKGDDIVDIIFQQPHCAPFITAKLWRYFVSDNPPDESQGKALAETLTKAEWKLGPFLRTLFNSAAFYDAKVMRSQIKSPLQFLVQMQKQLEVSGNIPPVLLLGAMQQLGQIPFRPPNVAGWEGGRAWINTSTLLARYNIAGAFTTGDASGLPGPQNRAGATRPAADRLRRFAVRTLAASPGVLAPEAIRNDPAKLIDALAWRFYNGPLASGDRVKFEAFVKEKSTDGFSGDDAGRLAHLMMSTPQYQVC